MSCGIGFELVSINTFRRRVNSCNTDATLEGKICIYCLKNSSFGAVSSLGDGLTLAYVVCKNNNNNSKHFVVSSTTLYHM